MGNRYKDSLFRSLFTDEDELRTLYNALKDMRYDKSTPLTINTLSETLFTGGKNDISFSIGGKLVILIEHQATLNKNMPFRFLPPVLRLFENSITDKNVLYQQKLIRLYRPEFIVLCNSLDDFPDYEVQRLSEAFLPVEGNTDINLELIVKVYNINLGHNGLLLAKHPTLYGYAFFVDLVRRYQAEEAARDPLGRRQDILTRAIVRAIETCKEQNILVEFWAGLSMEDQMMLATEWNLEDALAVRFREGEETGLLKGLQKGLQEGRQEGLQKGRQEGLQKGRQEERQGIALNARDALAQGVPLEVVSKISGMDIETIRRLSGNRRP